MTIEEQIRLIRQAHVSRPFHNWLLHKEKLNFGRIRLGELADMNEQLDKTIVRQWLLSNMDDVMHDLNRCQNMDLGLATLHGILTESKDIGLAVRYLEEYA